MKVTVTGASGLIGNALCKRLTLDGHEVIPIRLPRFEKMNGPVPAGAVDQISTGLSGADAVVHLAGENIAGRWTDAKMERIRASRVRGTQLLVDSLLGANPRPATLISVSATGFYGDRADEILTEESCVGAGFLADVSREWEGAATPAVEAGLRVVIPRLGIVLSGRGGALKKMLLPFQLGLGGPLGQGSQYWSWISLTDVVDFLASAITDNSYKAVYNLVSPTPVTNLEFTRILGTVLHRPTILPAPAFALRLAFKGMADEALLSSARVVPQRLKQQGFKFFFNGLAEALKAELQGTGRDFST